MIIVQLKGGLGNQLFQYAAGLSLAAHHGTKLKVDTSLLNTGDAEIGTWRGFDLQQLQLEPEVATQQEIDAVLPKNLAQKITDKLKPPYKRKVYREASFRFDPHFFEAASHIYLKGYRQSEKYFESIATEIRNGFMLKDAVIDNVAEYGRQLRAANSVSIHIRRGDYTNKQVSDFHGILDETYYQNAIRHMESAMPGCRFYIFSDAPDWVNENLNFNSPVELLSGDRSRTHFEDFHLVSCCRHHVIANSTFSWWAAWLNENPGKIVIAPKNWFNKAGHDTSDLIPEGWVRL